MQGRWYVLAAAAILGISAAAAGLSFWLLLLPIGLILIISLIYQQTRRLVCFGLLTVCLAYSYFHFIDFQNKTHLSRSQTAFTGTIVSLPHIDGNQVTFQLRLRSAETVRVSTYLDDKDQLNIVDGWRYGMVCHFSGELQRPSEAENFYAFNYRQYLYRHGIHWQLSPDTVKASSCQRAAVNPYERIKHWRSRGIAWIENHFPESIQGISEALLFGARRHVPDPILTAYQNLGLIHLLAVSGLHVGLMVGALYFIFLRLGITRERTLICLLILIPVYIILTGAAPSAIRAGCMTMVVLLALRFRRKLHPLDGISWVALGMLLWHPYAVFAVGFQLSFVTSFAIIASAPMIMQKYQSSMAQLLAISLIAQLVAFPLILYHFYSISLFNLPLNLIFVPFMSFFVLPVAAVAFFMTMLLPPLGTVLTAVLAFSLQIAHGLLLTVNGWPQGRLILGQPSLLMMVLFYTVLAYGFVKWETKAGLRRYLKPVSALIFLIGLQWSLPYLSPTGEVTMLDVDQGDSILIELPHRQAVYLIDTGGVVRFGQEDWQQQNHSYRIGRDLIVPQLKARGIRQIDKLILTHSDLDHVGGTAGLWEVINIKQLLYGVGPVDDRLVQHIFLQAKQHGTKIVRVREGMTWQEGGGYFQVLNPTGEETTDNNRSIVLYARLGPLSWLFTGDLEAAGETRLLREYPRLTVDVLKVAHHGSDTSTTEAFLNTVDPEVALISVGEHNLYGHPTPEVIGRLRKHDIMILRTDLNGSIRYTFGEETSRFSWVLTEEHSSR